MTALSRLQGIPKAYVQDRVRGSGEDAIRLLDIGANFYICLVVQYVVPVLRLLLRTSPPRYPPACFLFFFLFLLSNWTSPFQNPLLHSQNLPLPFRRPHALISKTSHTMNGTNITMSRCALPVPTTTSQAANKCLRRPPQSRCQRTCQCIG